MKPLEGIKVLDLSQFLSAPSATLRLADLGAEVLKVERPGGGDICRSLYISDCVIDGDSSLFHAINRNKKAISLDLKSADSRLVLERLVREADVMVVNYRPGVADRIGIGYEAMKALNPRLVYGEVSGYGEQGPWASKPGQDLLAQALSGICWLNGNADQPPTPMGLSVADLFAGQLLVQGVMAGLLRAKRTGVGAHVHVSLLEALLDMQFEVFTTYLNDGRKLPQRSAINNANAYISAPYGVYATADGYLALAMIPIPKLGELIGCEALLGYTDPDDWHRKRDEIKRVLVDHLAGETTAHWLGILEPADVWCADVYTWDTLMETEAFRSLDMIQTVSRPNGVGIATTCCPIRIDGERYQGGPAAPTIGQDNAEYLR
ncbi:CaiB/BaiF CoA transferase family protein [Bifidobacterium oedipodis]|uniref:L-carnitine dehydratase/bile acid-inducible protein F n=1 Tax=Bifidobacterium oedipodis TaxID=2675322 RepID=A0A7Y0HRX4_9BIFI|nr:CaiB/BaiF CoA-transferase family protein [Bifidobacterium sp. DSM 109957]NMM94545.1 L-carnitine dehydratase/bile acid-inducible protein F [Bifidobacterium sp. DSM 109957]